MIISFKKQKDLFQQPAPDGRGAAVKILSLPFFVCLFAILFTGCKKNTTPPDTGGPGKEKKIYAAGNVIVGDATSATKIATYWINDSAVSLSMSTSEAKDIVLSGKDLLIVGHTYDKWANNTRAEVWKNDINTWLYTLPTDGSMGEAVAVSGNDVYFAGLSSNLSASMQVATYWKNGVATQLSTTFSYANTLIVRGADVYVGGSDFIDGKGYTAAIWKNGNRTFLHTTGSVIYDMKIDGSDIYAVGSVNAKLVGQDIYPPFAAYWKNGVETVLSNVPYSSAKSIELIGKDVYIGVNENDPTNASINKDKLWKNGKSFALSTGNSAFYVADLAMADNQLYIAGYTGNDKNPKVWKWENDQLSLVLSYTVDNNIKRIFVQ